MDMRISSGCKVVNPLFAYQQSAEYEEMMLESSKRDKEGISRNIAEIKKNIEEVEKDISTQQERISARISQIEGLLKDMGNEKLEQKNNNYIG
jgi:flagellar capping protein FliD